jgi:hypothetical protein
MFGAKESQVKKLDIAHITFSYTIDACLAAKLC